MYLFVINLFVSYQIFQPKVLHFLKSFNSEYSCIEVRTTDQNFKPLGTEDKAIITLVINQSLKYNKDGLFN